MASDSESHKFAPTDACDRWFSELAIVQLAADTIWALKCHISLSSLTRNVLSMRDSCIPARSLALPVTRSKRTLSGNPLM